MGDLAGRVRRLPPRLLLPNLRLDAEAPDRLDLLDALALPRAGEQELLLTLLADPQGRVHVVVLAHDADLVRPARVDDHTATSLARIVGRGEVVPPFVRRRGPDLDRAPHGLTASPAPTMVESELVVVSDARREVTELGDDLVVVVDRAPMQLEQAPPDPLEHGRSVGMVLAAADHGDLVHHDLSWTGPLVSLHGRRPTTSPLVDELQAALLAMTRGGDAEPAVRLASSVAVTMASWHVALATPTMVLREPVVPATSEVLAEWRRSAADAVAEAAVLAESGSVQRLRGGRERLREAFASMDAAHGTAVVMGAPLQGLGSFRVERDGTVLLLPDHVRPSLVGHSPAQDVALLLRGIAHVAWTTHRRLVIAGEPAPVEQVADWENGMRQAVLDAYVARLVGCGHASLYDDDLLTAFEIQVECMSLVHSVRTLSAGTVVSDTALSALLAR